MASQTCDRLSDTQYITEAGIKCRNDFGNTPTEKCKLHNSKLTIFREFVLATLSQLCSEHNVGPPSAVDTTCSSGLAGLQWKKKLRDKVHVTIVDPSSGSDVEHNCAINDLQYALLTLDLCRPPGLPHTSQDGSTVSVCRSFPRVLLHLEAFDFIYLDPHKVTTNFFESVFSNIKNGGVVSLVVPNVSGFSRNPNVIRRMYDSTSMKTDYIKELACRTVLGAMARRAGSCNKGVEVLYCVSVEDFLLLAVRVSRGPQVADESMKLVRHLLHCQICQHRSFYPDQKAPLEDPYSLLPCNCRRIHDSKTAVTLGPMWCGNIFNTEFLKKIQVQGEQLGLSPKYKHLVLLLIEESVCAKSSLGNICSSDSVQNTKFVDTDDASVQASCKTETTTHSENSSNMHDEDDTSSCCADNPSTFSDNRPTNGDHASTTCAQSTGSEHSKDLETLDSRKRPADCEPGVKPCKVTRRHSQEETQTRRPQKQTCPPFYCSTLHRKQFEDVKVPKVGTMVSMLHSSGFRASRTHFDAAAVRTDATLDQIHDILKQNCAHKTKRR